MASELFDKGRDMMHKAAIADLANKLAARVCREHAVELLEREAAKPRPDITQDQLHEVRAALGVAWLRIDFLEDKGYRFEVERVAAEDALRSDRETYRKLYEDQRECARVARGELYQHEEEIARLRQDNVELQQALTELGRAHGQLKSEQAMLLRLVREETIEKHAARTAAELQMVRPSLEIAQKMIWNDSAMRAARPSHRKMVVPGPYEQAALALVSCSGCGALGEWRSALMISVLGSVCGWRLNCQCGDVLDVVWEWEKGRPSGSFEGLL